MFHKTYHHSTRRRARGFSRFAISLLLLASLISYDPSQGRSALPENQWSPRFPIPARIYRTPAIGSLAKNKSDIAFALHSLAGLAAKSVREGSGDTMLWLDLQGCNEYSASLLTDYLAATGVHDAGVLSAWELVDLFKDAGIVKGYILYDPDQSQRAPYAEGECNQSVNVATSMASILDAIILPPALENEARTHGLRLLFDARTSTQSWVWEHYQHEFSRNGFLVQDPQICTARDYSIALKTFCMSGSGPLLRAVNAAMNPHTPMHGWNQMVEYEQIKLASSWGHWNAADNHSSNLPLLSSLKPQSSGSVSDYDLNSKSRFDPIELTWEEEVNYVALVLSDGDAFNLNLYFLNDPERMFYQHPLRGKFPFTWGTAAADLYQLAPSALRLLVKQATPRDSFTLAGGGAYYPNHYGTARADAPLSGHLSQTRELMRGTGIDTILFCYSEWESAASEAARETVARELPDALAVLGYDVSSYSNGGGRILWNNNGQGMDIPTLMMRFCIWNNTPFPATDGTPLTIARRLNEMPHHGALNSSERFTWVMVHCWSFFQNGNDIPQQGVAADPRAGVERAFGSARWCAEALQPHVRLVTADKLAWLTRLHLRTSQTFNRMLDLASAELQSSATSTQSTKQMQRLAEIRDRVNHMDDANEAAKKQILAEVKAAWQEIRNSWRRE